MGDDRNSDGLESEEIPDSLLCCICLELLYKPVVLACGHISCFWCVHRSMSGRYESHCPICRHSYYHFPTVCEMLHLLLLKMYPDAYDKRKQQILEKEKEMDCFSPQFDAYSCASHMNHSVNHLNSSMSSSPSNLSSGSCFTKLEKSTVNLEQSESVSQFQDCGPSSGYFEVPEATAVYKTLTGNDVQKNSRQVSISDVMCTACKELLFRPAVLNCGHVFCETCIILPADELLRCPVCQSPDPRGIPKVCLMLNHFLEEHFLKEYALRRNVVVKQGSMNAGQQSVGLSSLPTGKQWWIEHKSKVHVNAGCDSCGMYPIVGDRYRCRDCVETIGFDLCGDCYNSRSKFPGRFNQQHTPEHRFVKVTRTEIGHHNVSRVILGQLDNDSVALGGVENGLNFIHDLSRLVMSHLIDGSDALILPNVVSEDRENSSTPFSADAQEDADGGSAASTDNSDPAATPRNTLGP